MRITKDYIDIIPMKDFILLPNHQIFSNEILDTCDNMLLRRYKVNEEYARILSIGLADYRFEDNEISTISSTSIVFNSGEIYSRGKIIKSGGHYYRKDLDDLTKFCDNLGLHGEICRRIYAICTKDIVEC